MFCSVGRPKTSQKTTENRQIPPKIAQNTTKTTPNLYKKRGGGLKAINNHYKKRLFHDHLPKKNTVLTVQFWIQKQDKTKNTQPKCTEIKKQAGSHLEVVASKLLSLDHGHLERNNTSHFDAHVLKYWITNWHDISLSWIVVK